MDDSSKDKIYYISVDDILPNRFQPRLHFDENELNELAGSILKYGVIQPIVVRKITDKYEIIAGERRYKAACLAGLKTIPAIINNTDDNTSAEIALLENLQRKNLTVIEEAQSYKKLMDRGFTQEDIANKLGISQSSIANKLRLLNLPKEVRDALLYNQISERHARSLLSLNNEDLQKSLLKRIIDEKLTVKQTEDEISSLLMKNIYKPIDNIEDNLERFLRPEPISQIKDNVESNDKIDEILDFKIPEVVSTNLNNEEKIEDIKFDNDTKNEDGLTEIVSNNENINPFISNNTYKKLEEEPINYDETDSLQQELDKYLNKNDNLIDKVKDFTSELKNNNSVKVTELNLDNKYQIIIEIDKN